MRKSTETGGVGDLGDQPERKITRNQKRKHDEINHVQKVGTLSIAWLFCAVCGNFLFDVWYLYNAVFLCRHMQKWTQQQLHWRRSMRRYGGTCVCLSVCPLVSLKDDNLKNVQF